MAVLRVLRIDRVREVTTHKPAIPNCVFLMR
jgi:hypothetical protein